MRNNSNARAEDVLSVYVDPALGSSPLTTITLREDCVVFFADDAIMAFFSLPKKTSPS